MRETIEQLDLGARQSQAFVDNSKERGGRPRREEAAAKAWERLAKTTDARRGVWIERRHLAARPPHSPAPVRQEPDACG